MSEVLKKPRTKKQIAATEALVARNKQKKLDRLAMKQEADAASLESVNLKISQIIRDEDSGSELEAPAQKESDTEESESSSSDSDESKEEEVDDQSEEDSNEDDPAKAYDPQDFASETEDGGYMTHLEQANVETKRKRPLHKGLLSRRW